MARCVKRPLYMLPVRLQVPVGRVVQLGARGIIGEAPDDEHPAIGEQGSGGPLASYCHVASRAPGASGWVVHRSEIRAPKGSE